MNLIRDDINEKLKQAVLKRDGYRCRYCGVRSKAFHIDHVYPFSKGGETSMKNLVAACPECNLKKHNSLGIFPKPIGFFVFRNVLPITLIGVLSLIFGATYQISILFIFGIAISIPSLFYLCTWKPK